MSKLEKLLIQGIRSFNPRDKNIIEFQCPLTLIVGANGTGKTTIIECLKFATTGDMPPNSRGGAFVYDPKLANQIDVKAEVKLRFQNTKNESLICSRTIQASLKKSKAEQKTLECSLSKELNEKELLISSKIADIDKQVPDNLGISHSILDNVIFCHQDESTWPIGDPTVMKKKLDDIFSSTKYNKALLGLKASKKEISSDLKLKIQQLSFFLKEKLKKDEIVKKIELYTEEVEKKNLKIKTFGDEIARLTSKLQVMHADLKIYEKLESNNRILKSEMENCLKFINNFTFPILIDLNKEKIMNKIDMLKKSLDSLNNCQIETDFKNVEEIRQKIVDQDLQNTKYSKALEELQKTIENLENEKKKLVTSLTNELLCSESEIKLKAKESFEKLEQELKQQTCDLNIQREKLTILQNDQKNHKDFLKESTQFIEKYKDLKLLSDCDLSEIPIDYNMQIDLEATLDELLESLSIKQNMFTSMFSNSDNHYRRKHILETIEKLSIKQFLPLDTYKQEIEVENHKKIKICNELKSLLQLNLKNIALNEQRSISNKKIIDEINSLLKTITNIEIPFEIVNLIERNNENLTSNEILFIKTNFPKHLLVPDTLEDIKIFEDELNKAKDKISTIESARKVYENFLKLGCQNNNCPLCIRAFEGQSKEEFNLRLQEILKKLPINMENAQSAKVNCEIKLNDIKKRNLSKLTTNEAKLKIQELLNGLLSYEPVYHNEIKILEQEKEQVELSITKLNEIYKEAMTTITTIQAMNDELALIPENIEAKPLEEEIKELKRTIDLKRKEMAECLRKIKEGEARKKLIQQEMEKQKIIEKRDSLISKLANMKVADIGELEAYVLDLEKKRETLNQKSIKNRMLVEMKIKRIEEIEQQINRFGDEVGKISSKIITSYINATVNFNKETLTFEDLRSHETYERIRSEVITKKNQIIEITKEIEKAKYDLQIVEENIKLEKYKERKRIIEEELSKFDIKSFNQLKSEILLVDEKKSKLISSESLIRGELKQIVHTIKTLNTELVEYKESNKNYLNCSIEIKVLELSSEDLDKCISGLDKAIVDFHKTKIEEVNRTLKELWMNTYRGNDIDYIELKAESSETRAYNYRLVMVKNGVELDMRGRSSAGQKMISSLLFRIALSDSFSQGCNVFALDEPTTNLDKENIESLAYTLSSIIKTRKNTQFVVITHDEDFVQLLNREGTEYFYRLIRDSSGNSHIQRHSIYK